MTPLSIIQSVTVFSLWDSDGSCPCGSFYIRGIKVEFECWRMSDLFDGCRGSLIIVSASHDLQPPKEDLIEIGRECRRQVKEVWKQTEWYIKVRWGAYEGDDWVMREEYVT